MPKKPTPSRQPLPELEALRARLDEAEEALSAIRSGEVDALIVPGLAGEQVFTLKGADRLFRVLIEDMNEGALTLTAEGVILYANRRLGEMLKSPLEKIIGSSIHAWIAPESKKIILELLRLDDTQVRRRGEVMLLTGDGTLMSGYLALNMLKLEEMQGYFCMVATDLTEQKRTGAIEASEKLARDLLKASNQSRLALLSMIEDQGLVEKTLQKSEERYRTLVEAQMEAVCRWLPDTTLTFVNEAYCHLAGKTREELIGQKWIELEAENERTRSLDIYMDAASTKEVHSYEDQVESPDGILWYRWTDIPLFDGDGNIHEFQSVGHDITERKAAEETLQSQLDELRRWHTVMMDREGRVIELKREVNGLLRELGRPEKFGD